MRLWILVILLASIVVLGGIAVVERTPDVSPLTEDRESYWEQKLQEEGLERGFDEFERFVANMALDDQHEEAHSFGGALYDVFGLKGVEGCSHEYIQGCFHEFFGRGLSLLGPPVMEEFNNYCFSDGFSLDALLCQHGVGHGALAFFGYKLPDLRQALELCDTLEGNDPIRGCESGVFMEFNLRSMLAGDAPQRTSSEDVAFPCNSIDEEHRLGCYFWQGQWWRHVVLAHMPAQEAFVRASEFCLKSTSNERLLQACYGGLGNIIPLDVNLDAEESARWCSVITKENIHDLYCRMRVFRSTRFVDPELEKSELAVVCGGLPKHLLGVCSSYVRGERPGGVYDQNEGIFIEFDQILFMGPQQG